MTQTDQQQASPVQPSPMHPGTRVSLEFPQAGTCVAVVASLANGSVVLDLLDPLPEADLSVGAPIEMFMARPDGIYYWACAISGPPSSDRATLELLGPPVFVQRRIAHRVEAGVQAQVRRSHTTRRGKAHQMRVVDLSRGGMKLEGEFQLSTGDTVEVSFEADDKVAIACRAVMAYPLSEGKWAAHLCFLDGQREALDVVDAFIARRIKKLS